MGFLWVYSDEVAVLDRQAFSDETAAAHAQEAHLAGTSTEGSRLMMASDSSWPQQDQHTSMLGGEERSSGYGVKAEMADSNMVRFGFRIAALMLGMMMIIASFVELWNLSSFTRFFIAIYNIIFASLLILHESQGLVMCEGVDSNLRRYFGLLYGHMGRALFIIFIAFLNFALTDAGLLGTFTGLLLLLLGGVMVVVFLKYPHLLDEAPGLGDLKTAPPRQDDYAPPPTMPSTNL